MARIVNLHGVELDVPPEWRDQSVYRFDLPAVDALKPLPVATRASSKPAFHANVVVTTVAVSGPFTADAVFGAANRKRLQENPTYTVVASGTARLGERTALWQEVAFTITDRQCRLFQRQAAIPVAANAAVLVTLTSDRKHCAEALAQMGLRWDPTS